MFLYQMRNPLVYKFIVPLLILFGLSFFSVSHAEKNLAVICSSAQAGDNGDIPCQVGRYGRPTTSDLVRVCKPTGCVRDSTFVYQPFGSLPNTTYIDACTTDIPINSVSPYPWKVENDLCKSWAATLVTATQSSSSGPSPISTITLTWAPVTENTDGTPSNLGGYRIYSGATAAETSLGQLAEVNAGTLSFVVPIFAPGTYYYAVTAFSTQNIESRMSAVVSKLIEAPAPTPATPSSPTGVSATVSDAVAYRIDITANKATAKEVGKVMAGTSFVPIAMRVSDRGYCGVRREAPKVTLNPGIKTRPSVVYVPCN